MARIIAPGEPPVKRWRGRAGRSSVRLR